LVDPVDPDLLTPRQERLLVRKALQARPRGTVTDELEFPSSAECMRAFADAVELLCDSYGDEQVREERRRFQ
ncbi:MAG: tRNA(Met) cytidine acetyltransferase, partial [Haloarculaceae archaeon]